MSWLKFSLMLSTGVLLVGLSSRTAMSQGGPPPRDRDTAWDNAPVPGGREPGPPPDARRPQPPRGDQDGPPGPPDMRRGPNRGEPQPPRGADERRPGQPRAERREPRPPMEGTRGSRENGPPPDRREGDRPQPPGPPPGSPNGYEPRGREDFEMMRARDPELFQAMQADRELERATREMAEHYRQAGKDEQAKIKDKLVEIVGKHFEVRQQMRNLEVKRIEQQLKLLRGKIDQREKNRKEIIEKRIIELTGADEAEHF